VWGYGGIRNESVDDIIAKAQYTEQFLNSAAYCGLDGSNLAALAKLGDEEDAESKLFIYFYFLLGCFDFFPPC